MNNVDKRKEKILEVTAIVVGIIVIISVIIGLTYSFFTAVITGSQQTPDVVTSAILDIDFQTSEYINNPNMMLIEASNFLEEAERAAFTVSNHASATVPSRYSISLVNIDISDNFKSSDLIWMLRKNGVDRATGNFQNIGNATEKVILASEDLPLNQTDNWTLHLGLILADPERDQANLQNGNISFRVRIIAVQQ